VSTTLFMAAWHGAYARHHWPPPRRVAEGAADGTGRGGDRRDQQDRRARGSQGPSLPVRFPLGRLVATPGALAALERAGANPVRYLACHATCDWGDVDTADWAANDRALVDGERLLSAYVLPNGERLLLSTEADRSRATLLVPGEA
jgi:hypothetical protein